MNRIVIGKINAIAIYITWTFLAVLVIGIVGIILKFERLVPLIPVGFGGLIIFGLLHVMLSFYVRCPVCNKMLTFQGTKKPVHAPNSNLDGWAYTALMWFTGNVTCIHCGSSVYTDRL